MRRVEQDVMIHTLGWERKKRDLIKSWTSAAAMCTFSDVTLRDTLAGIKIIPILLHMKEARAPAPCGVNPASPSSASSFRLTADFQRGLELQQDGLAQEDFTGL